MKMIMMIYYGDDEQYDDDGSEDSDGEKDSLHGIY